MRPTPPQDLPHPQANEATALFFERVAAQLAPLGADRATALLAHLATGEPADVPVDPALFEALRLEGFDRRHDPTLYQHADQLPVAVLLRWAKLLAAALAPHASSFHMVFPDGRHWPEALLTYSAGGTVLGHIGSATADKVPAATFEALLAADDLAPSALLVAALTPPVGEDDDLDFARFRQRLVKHMPGYADHLDRHLETVRPSLSPADEDVRLHVLRLLDTAHDTTLSRVATEIAQMAVAKQRRVRSKAEDLVRRSLDTAVPALRVLAASGKSTGRGLALRLLGSIAQEHGWADLWTFTWQTAHAQPSQAAEDLRAEWRAAGFGEVIAPAPLPVEPATVPFRSDAPTDEALARFWSLVQRDIEAHNDDARESQEEFEEDGHDVALNLLAQPDRRTMDALHHCLRNRDWRTGPQAGIDRFTAWNLVGPQIAALAEAGDLSPGAALRMLWFFDVLADDDSLLRPVWDVFTALRRGTGEPTLRGLRSIVESARVPGESLNSWPWYAASTEADWPGEVVWPYLRAHMHEVIRDMDARAGERGVLYRAIASMPAPPEPLLAALFEVALGSGKARAKEAQDALAGHPDLARRLEAARTDTRAAVRKNAEAWAARLG
ncbi:hypothetical protein [Piscinibacter gummiphilus]|uniref:hypothetical protein n=1 Tax=Piscinibacter gummiphilus TaxID=946333 RepID=UPI000C1B48B4|nr:hypothetical protein [Piscinibacter gummiphilus]ATU67260.1 hypothetical protein CPZ87_23225 [Piscinibacter gummiphilus]GLS98154.1 hypothetical protein GCM10007918_54460 [Piscinibacter gummiphilus]